MTVTEQISTTTLTDVHRDWLGKMAASLGITTANSASPDTIRPDQDGVSSVSRGNILNVGPDAANAGSPLPAAPVNRADSQPVQRFDTADDSESTYRGNLA